MELVLPKVAYAKNGSGKFHLVSNRDCQMTACGIQGSINITKQWKPKLIRDIEGDEYCFHCFRGFVLPSAIPGVAEKAEALIDEWSDTLKAVAQAGPTIEQELEHATPKQREKAMEWFQSAQQALKAVPATIHEGMACPRENCEGHMRKGTAIENTFVASWDFYPGDETVNNARGCTMNYGGSGKLAAAFKCDTCGFSYRFFEKELAES